MMKRKKISLALGILMVVCAVVGMSYAYWVLTYSQTGMNKLTSSCFSLSLTNESNAIKLENAYPILDEEGKKLTPYSFTITNTCDLFASYTVNLEILENSTLDSKYIKVMLNNEAIQNLNEYESTITTITGSIDSKVLAQGSLGSGDSVDYTLRLWMNENITMEDTEAMNKLFRSKIVISATVGTYSPVEQGYTTLADAILANEYQSTPEIAKQKINEKQEVDFTKTAPLIEWQESHANTTTTTTATMPHSSLVGTGGIAANLTAENVLPLIGTSYSFNSETGQYTIGNLRYVDPTTLDYNENINYYFCNAGFNTNANDLITPFQNTSNCATIYRIVSATSENGIATGAGGTQFTTQIYYMNAYKYTQLEKESDNSDKGLYQMDDDHGTSYYYRGNVTNNYVSFAGYYWRIIRINDDGSVRLLYAGTTPDAIGTNLQIKTSSFNTVRTDPGYVGYMYGNTFNSSYNETHANEVKSSIMKELDNWYETSILKKGLNDYIADSGFCNDRSISSGSDGVSTTASTYFEGYNRYIKSNPTLICPNASHDLFTMDNGHGNRALTYPVGLITVDELMLGGIAFSYLNKRSYTYSSVHYWTITPAYFYANDASALGFMANFQGSSSSGWITYALGIRPVLSLKPTVKISGGIGTVNDPFVVAS